MFNHKSLNKLQHIFETRDAPLQKNVLMVILKLVGREK
jgi:hypothetical protein